MRIPLVLIASALFVAACGSDSSTTTDASTKDSGGGMPVPSASTNFEDGTDGWTNLDPKSDAKRDKSTAYAGKASIVVKTVGKTKFEGARSMSSPVEPGKTYSAVAWVQARKGVVMQLSLRQRDKDDSDIGGKVTAFTGTGEWKRVEVSDTFAEAAENARIVVRTGAGPEDVEFNVDAVTLEQD